MYNVHWNKNDTDAVTPTGLSIDKEGNMYVADAGGHRIMKYDYTGELDGSFGIYGAVGSYGDTEAHFNQPTGIAVGHDGNIYVTDTGNNRIQVFDPTGQFITQWGTPGVEPGQLYRPAGFYLRASSMSDELFIADTGNNRIQRFGGGGGFVSAVGSSGSGPGQFSSPANACYDRRFDQLIIADAGNNRIQLFQLNSFGDFKTANMIYTGRIAEIAGATPPALSSPLAAACASTETSQIIYIADTGNNRIVKIELPRFKPGQSPLHTWEAFKAALRAGDTDKALTFIYESSQTTYSNIFTTFSSHLQELVDAMGDMELDIVEPGSVKYYVHHETDGQNYIFPVFFLEDENGNWQIYKF